MGAWDAPEVCVACHKPGDDHYVRFDDLPFKVACRFRVGQETVRAFWPIHTACRTGRTFAEVIGKSVPLAAN